MSLDVLASSDAAEILAAAGEHLARQPVLNNLVLSLLHERAAGGSPGRYWVVRDGGAVAGVGFQSPLSFPLLLIPMGEAAVVALADAIAAAGIALPGVHAEAATAARFAGRWAERCNVPARPESGLRIYECGAVRLPQGVAGGPRRAAAADRDRLVAWTTAFAHEVGEATDDPDGLVDRRLGSGLFWLWQVEGRSVAMAAQSTPLAGAVRIQYVYTPPAERGRGYAGACVGHLSHDLRGQGLRCMLYTALINPTSNSVYRRIGYRAVAEGLRYSFG